MLQVSHLLHALAAVYGAVGLVVLRRLFEPSCRVCAHRHSCPNREGNHPSEAASLTCIGN